ncbi:Protein TAPT1 homolog [Taphrina deformans PYCC 5710]|uniref:Protein TAPT1 homolog n=1 Tax=Taphrina deformans (strain PYCC 5710 / ATCC 11124 / CBS 356.35 / IMI 108563 / JCM 9778 / NBRC 8474) TaxID=1097556 RepID=R4XBK6_TAPDE|nr:Protein TAPT1 homolog [Taphrina deformans PYCC 5710]|eukprot:CCG81756.1 Protein TAPT1 homolog [Taphrina deformans PYCC 5710]
MKATERWKDPSHPSQQSNRFDIFTDVSKDTFKGHIKLAKPLATTNPLFRNSENSPAAPSAQPAIGHRSGIRKENNLRRNSFPTAPESSIDVVAIKPKCHPVELKSSDINKKDVNGRSERSRSEIRRQSSTPFSLWDYLKVELAATDSDEAHDFKRERVRNFLILPDALERTLMFGFIVCLDSFLYIFTILPLRFSRSTISLIQRLAGRCSSLKSSQKVDLLKGGLILMTCIVLNQLDASRIYHNIRGQAAIKLYVLYNVLEIGDKLFCALGQDILDCLFSKSTFGRKEDGTRRHLRPIAFLLLAVVYNVLHTILLFYQLVTLNVTVNSFSNALMTLLLSNQFVEIKGSVFKKFEKEGLFQITCADMVERFQLFIMLLIIGLRNTFEMSPNTLGGLLTTTLGPLTTVLGSEILVDWLKHAFITKFNHVRPTIYARFTDVLCRDYVKSGTVGGRSDSFVDQSPAISRRIGLPVLPLVCLTIRSAGQILTMVMDASAVSRRGDGEGVAAGGWEEKAVRVVWCALIAVLVFMTLVIIKLSIGVSLIRFAHGRYGSMQAREVEEAMLEAERKRKDVFKGIVELDGDTKKILNDKRDNLTGEEGGRGLLGLERYSMISKRIW